MLFPEYDGCNPPFFAEKGEIGVSLKYIRALREILGLRVGQSLIDYVRFLTTEYKKLVRDRDFWRERSKLLADDIKRCRGLKFRPQSMESIDDDWPCQGLGGIPCG